MSLFNAEANRGWVMLKDFEWLECEVVDSSNTHLSLRIEGGETRTLDKRKANFFCRNSATVEKSDDFLTLPYLDEPNILHSLRCRYWAKEVYSYTGPILIAVNPWQRHPIYTKEIMEKFSSGTSSSPHIFGIAAKAKRALQADRRSQCLLISGESGSGKTENAKYVLQVLTAGSPGTKEGSTSTTIEQQVMLTNPVLEAFGNAKTLRNDNSSRFGKWISISFSGNKVTGAEIRTCLLEKSRVVHQGVGERNFHIFYQACECASESKLLSGLQIGPASAYDITKTTLQAHQTDDRANFAETKQAMDYIGFGRECQQNLFSVLSAVLHMGNLPLDEDCHGHAVLEAGERHLVHAAKMLSVPPEALVKALCFRKIRVGGESLEKHESKAMAVSARDALNKALYTKLFDWVVKLVNKTLRSKAMCTSQLQVSVLDIFGFEIFPKNCFEQFCINYSNEKLQLHFNQFHFMQERLLYEREGIELVESDFVDNSACVQLLEARGWGVQSLLDETCLMPAGDDTKFLDHMNTNKDIKKCRYFVQSRQRTGTFTIAHYAGSVTYHAEGFVEKNRDRLPTDVVELMHCSTNPFIKDLFEGDAPEAAATTSPKNPSPKASGAASRQDKSLSFKFKEDLASLVCAIEASGPHFVRCVNPNAEKKMECFSDQKAIEQLRCGGVIEAVCMCRESYPCRMTHQQFVNTFLCVVQGVQEVTNDPLGTSLAMVKKLALEDRMYRLGKTMVLLKSEVVDRLEKVRGEQLGWRMVILQTAVRNFVAKKMLVTHMRRVKALVLETYMKQACARRAYAGTLAGWCATGGAQSQAGVVWPEIKFAVLENLKALGEPLTGPAGSIVIMSTEGGSTWGDYERASEITPKIHDSQISTVSKEEDADDSEGEQSRKLRKKKGDFPLCIRIEVSHSEGYTDSLLFDVEVALQKLRKAVVISDNRNFLSIYANTFKGFAALSWLRVYAGQALYGDKEGKGEKNQSIARSVALLIAYKMLAVGVFKQVCGDPKSPFEDVTSLFRFHEDDETHLLNSKTLWLRGQVTRKPLKVVSDLLYAALQLRSKYPKVDNISRAAYQALWKATSELQLVDVNSLSRLGLQAFFLNTYNLIVLHAHSASGIADGTSFQPLRATFLKDTKYLIAANTHSLAEIEERLFCRSLRAKLPKGSEKSRAPEPRFHFALSLGCTSSPHIRIYSAETLDKDLQAAGEQFCQSNMPRNQVAIKHSSAACCICEISLPRMFKWFAEDFGYTKTEVLCYYASFLPAEMKDKVLEVARSENFVIKHEEFDWSLNVTKACCTYHLSRQRKVRFPWRTRKELDDTRTQLPSRRDGRRDSRSSFWSSMGFPRRQILRSPESTVTHDSTSRFRTHSPPNSAISQPPAILPSPSMVQSFKDSRRSSVKCPDEQPANPGSNPSGVGNDNPTWLGGHVGATIPAVTVEEVSPPPRARRGETGSGASTEEQAATSTFAVNLLSATVPRTKLANSFAQFTPSSVLRIALQTTSIGAPSHSALAHQPLSDGCPESSPASVTLPSLGYISAANPPGPQRGVRKLFDVPITTADVAPSKARFLGDEAASSKRCVEARGLEEALSVGNSLAGLPPAELRQSEPNADVYRGFTC